MEKKRTEAFRNFIKDKEYLVSDAFLLFERCIEKLSFIEDYFFNRNRDDGHDFEGLALGVGFMIEEVKGDLKLLLAEWEGDAELAKRNKARIKKAA